MPPKRPKQHPNNNRLDPKTHPGMVSTSLLNQIRDAFDSLDSFVLTNLLENSRYQAFATEMENVLRTMASNKPFAITLLKELLELFVAKVPSRKHRSQVEEMAINLASLLSKADKDIPATTGELTQKSLFLKLNAKILREISALDSTIRSKRVGSISLWNPAARALSSIINNLHKEILTTDDIDKAKGLFSLYLTTATYNEGADKGKPCPEVEDLAKSLLQGLRLLSAALKRISPPEAKIPVYQRQPMISYAMVRTASPATIASHLQDLSDQLRNQEAEDGGRHEDGDFFRVFMLALKDLIRDVRYERHDKIDRMRCNLIKTLGIRWIRHTSANPSKRQDILHVLAKVAVLLDKLTGSLPDDTDDEAPDTLVGMPVAEDIGLANAGEGSNTDVMGEEGFDDEASMTPAPTAIRMRSARRVDPLTKVANKLSDMASRWRGWAEETLP
jgi:hypothetical protein